MNDEWSNLLGRMNRSELVRLARDVGLGNVSRETSIPDLVEMILSEEGAEEDALGGKRQIMEEHIKKYYSKYISQLPGCDGCCTTYGCPDLIVMRCWVGFKDVII